MAFADARRCTAPGAPGSRCLADASVPEGFRSTETGRKALRSYRLWIATLAAFGLLGMMLFPVVTVPALLAIPVVGITAFASQNRKLKPYAIQPPPVAAGVARPAGRPAVVRLAGARSSVHVRGLRSVLTLALGPDSVALPGSFRLQRNAEPMGGTDDSRGLRVAIVRSRTRGLSVRHGAGWMVRITPFRPDAQARDGRIASRGVDHGAALLFTALKAGRGCGDTDAPDAAGAVSAGDSRAGIRFPAIHAAARSRRSHAQRRCWKAGIIYYNPNDAVLFVQRRDSMGFTLWSCGEPLELDDLRWTDAGAVVRTATLAITRRVTPGPCVTVKLSPTSTGGDPTCRDRISFSLPYSSQPSVCLPARRRIPRAQERLRPRLSR